MGWFPKLDEYVTLSDATKQKLNELSNVSNAQLGLMTSGCALSFVVGLRLGKVRPSWKRYTDIRDIPKDAFETRKVFRGRVLSVSDGDTVRILHTPTWWSTKTLQENEKLSTTALPIRLCTIDTPETAKFGKPGQPFGEQAKERLSQLLLDRTVSFTLLAADQYGRGVAEVYTGRFLFWKQYADEKMLQAGLAEVYLGSGAVYGRLGKEHYLNIQEAARKKKKGIWSDPRRESAAEYKARLKQDK